MTDNVLRHWIFDMDGTLTVPTHNFDSVREEIDIPVGHSILEYLDTLSDQDAQWRHERLEEIEWEHARMATADPEAVNVLSLLRDRGLRVGVVTRNGLDIAYETLRAAGLDDFFDEPSVIARECAAPKPEPDGIRLLLSRWQIEDARESVMIGDYVHDLKAGRSAGATTVHLDHEGNRPFMNHADYVIDRLGDLRELIEKTAPGV